VPEGAEVIDAAGKVISPGFVAISMQGIGLRARGGSTQSGELADTLNPFDSNIKFMLSSGITSGCAELSAGGGGRRGRRDPEQPFVGLDPDQFALEAMQSSAERDFGDDLPTCPCCGLTYLPYEPIDEAPAPPVNQNRHVVVKMSYGSLDNMLAREDTFVDPPAGGLTSAQAKYNWRKQFELARKYLQELAEHEKAVKAGEKTRPPRNSFPEAFLKLVKKEIAMKVSAESVGQIRDAIELARELDYRIVIERATESWLIPEELSQANVSVIITPRSQRRPRLGAEDTSGSSIETPRFLSEAGVPFAVAALSNSFSLGGLAGRDLASLPLEAMFAVRGGATEAQALEAITITPARMLGMADQIGSLEVGKDADILIMDGVPMDYRTYVEIAIVNGRQVYNRAEDRVMPVFPKNR
jgi:hypothetical protein